jgi:uncharacterized membrane-anchored protein YhcB (DUF1043 family)
MKIVISLIMMFWVAKFFVEDFAHQDTKEELRQTKAQLNSYKVKLFESAYRLNRCEGER